MMPGVQPPSQQATRHARRVYVGGLPPTGNEQNIATFFSNALAAIGGTTAGPGKPALSIVDFLPFATSVTSNPTLAGVEGPQHQKCWKLVWAELEDL